MAKPVFGGPKYNEKGEWTAAYKHFVQGEFAEWKKNAYGDSTNHTWNWGTVVNQVPPLTPIQIYDKMGMPDEVEPCNCPECNYTEDYVERTLVLLKPDAFERNLVGEIMNIIDSKDLKLVAAKQVEMDLMTIQKHYKNHVGKNFFPQLVEFMQSGPSLALVYEGNKACQAVRQLIGEKHPTNSPPGSIRGKYASEYPRNLIHGSDDPHQAEYEITLYFTETEMFGSAYSKNLKSMQAKQKKIDEEKKKKIIEEGVTPGGVIPYPQMVKKGMIIKNFSSAYKVLGSTKKAGGKQVLTICNTSYVDDPDAKANHTLILEYSDSDWGTDTWTLLINE